MPWYWTDELARALIAEGHMDAAGASGLIARPVAIRREETTVEEAASALAEEGEVPLAA